MRKVNGFKLILWNGKSQTIKDKENISPASEYNDPRFGGKQGLTLRQENFYQNLLQLHRLLNYSKKLPVSFTDDEGNYWYLDKGCVKMAVNSEFLENLKDNDVTGYVTEVYLTNVGLDWIKKRLK